MGKVLTPEEPKESLGRDMADWGGDGLPSGTGKMVGQAALGRDAAGFPLGLSEARKVLWRNVGGLGLFRGTGSGGGPGSPVNNTQRGEMGGPQPLPRW